MPSEDGTVTLQEIKDARKTIMESPLGVRRTPMLKGMTPMFPELDSSVELFIKLESMQTTGSFKLRGVANQIQNAPTQKNGEKKKLITMSAGNYGKAFAYTLNAMKIQGMCIMPLTAPSSRVELIKKYGVNVEQVPNSELSATVDLYVKEKDYTYFHSFDDLSLIAGYGSYGCEVSVIPSFEIDDTIAQYKIKNWHYLQPLEDRNYLSGCGSVALEILEDGVKPDVVVVCCGGGGIVSGIAAGIKLSGLTDCRIYAVEPEGSRTMYESFKKGEPVHMNVNSVAAGLSPPFAGAMTYKHCKAFVEDVILVSDREILNCMQILYERGLVAEPSGCAAMAAILNNKIPNVARKKVVAVITGGNVTLAEMMRYSQSNS